MRADQKGASSASELAIVACIPGSSLEIRPAPEGYSHAHVSMAS